MSTWTPEKSNPPLRVHHHIDLAILGRIFGLSRARSGESRWRTPGRWKQQASASSARQQYVVAVQSILESSSATVMPSPAPEPSSTATASCSRPRTRQTTLSPGLPALQRHGPPMSRSPEPCRSPARQFHRADQPRPRPPRIPGGQQHRPHPPWAPPAQAPPGYVHAPRRAASDTNDTPTCHKDREEMSEQTSSLTRTRSQPAQSSPEPGFSTPGHDTWTSHEHPGNADQYAPGGWDSPHEYGQPEEMNGQGVFVPGHDDTWGTAPTPPYGTPRHRNARRIRLGPLAIAALALISVCAIWVITLPPHSRHPAHPSRRPRRDS